MFNLSLEERIVPSEWERSQHYGAIQDGIEEQLRNFQTSELVCKLLETLIRDHMVEFLIKQKLINISQPVDVVYLDFQKAFDKVQHQRLLLKLKSPSHR